MVLVVNVLQLDADNLSVIRCCALLLEPAVERQWRTDMHFEVEV